MRYTTNKELAILYLNPVHSSLEAISPSSIPCMGGLVQSLVIVRRISIRSFSVGSPTYSVLSKRPGRSTAGSMISVTDTYTCNYMVIIRKMKNVCVLYNPSLGGL